MAAYLRFHRLEKSPFEGEGGDRLVLATEALRRAYTEIRSGLDEGSPRICVGGARGIGKSTLARALPKLLGADTQCVLIRDPSRPWSHLKATIVKRLDLRGGLLSRNSLLEVRRGGRRLALIIDQAELLPRASLDRLDVLLGYRDEDGEQLLHCILLANMESGAGEEVAPLVWWLDQLTTRQLTLLPISESGIRSYIDKHLAKAGWRGESLFTDGAAVAIHRYTGGIPGTVSALCEALLAKAAELELHRVDAAVVAAMCGDDGAGDTSGDEFIVSSNGLDPDGELTGTPSTLELDTPVPEAPRPLPLSEIPEPVVEYEPEPEIQQGLQQMEPPPEAEKAFEDSYARPSRLPEARPLPARPAPESGVAGSVLRNLAAAAVIGIVTSAAISWVLDEPLFAPIQYATRSLVTLARDAGYDGKPVPEPALVEGEGLTSDLVLHGSPPPVALEEGAEGPQPTATEKWEPGFDAPPEMSIEELLARSRIAEEGPPAYEPWTEQLPEAMALPTRRADAPTASGGHTLQARGTVRDSGTSPASQAPPAASR